MVLRGCLSVDLLEEDGFLSISIYAHFLCNFFMVFSGSMLRSCLRCCCGSISHSESEPDISSLCL
jgi:hypothetical protein